MDKHEEALRPTDVRQDRLARAGLQRVIDPSDAVTGMAFLFGAAGAVVGIGAALVFSPEISFWMIVYCFLAALAGVSAGVVAGGMVGAAFAVARGVPKRPEAADAHSHSPRP
jgi:hypothetical protein